MKTLHYCIVAIACVVAASVMWYLTSYDSTPIITTNNFGINALVIHSPPYMACPTEDCKHPDYYLKTNSKSKTFLVGYSICDKNSCVKKAGIIIPLPLSDVLHPDYAKLSLPYDLSWKDGDSINIWVKVQNSSMIGNTLYFDYSDAQNVWVYLGKSEIVRSS